jgi:hypothetical protein
VGSGVASGVGEGDATPAWTSGIRTELDPVVDRSAWNPTTSPTDIAIIARLKNRRLRRVAENGFFMTDLNSARSKLIRIG